MLTYTRSSAVILTIVACLIGSAPSLCLGQRRPQEILLTINEFMASNDSFIQDPQGQYDDWIEIHNYGAYETDIGGMYLTDDLSVPTKW